MNLDDFSIPLYSPQLEETIDDQDISKLDVLFQNADGYDQAMMKFDMCELPHRDNWKIFLQWNFSYFLGRSNSNSIFLNLRIVKDIWINIMIIFDINIYLNFLVKFF